MIAYISKYYMKVLTMLFEHSLLVFISVGISFLLALILSIIAHKYKTMSGITLTLFIGIYCIPSIALFAFLIPVTGLGKQTAIIALVLYNQVLLIRSILEGFNSVPSETIEVVKGLGIGFSKA